MDRALRAASDSRRLAFDRALRTDRLPSAVSRDDGDSYLHSPASPIEEHAKDVRRERRQQRQRHRHMNIQPQVEASLERDVAPYAPEELLLTQQQRVQLLVGSRRVPAQCFAEELDPIGGRGCRTIRIVARKLPPPRSPDSRLLRSRQNSLIETVRQLQRQLASLLVEIGNLQQQRALGLVAHV